LSKEVLFRRVTAQDREFLSALALSRWSALPIPGLAAMQDRAQRAAYVNEYGPDGEHLVIVDGEPVGRAWWADDGETREIVDVALIPSAQRQRLGSRIFTDLIAGAEGRRVTCTVDRSKTRWLDNLRRLGFTEVSGDALNANLERPADVPS
jgi:ribosomal protein S18 acetylase RimI-like enzyme